MALEKLPSGKWRARIYQGGRAVWTSGAVDKKSDAKQLELTYKQRALDSEIGLVQNRMPIIEAAEQYAMHLLDRSKRHRRECIRVIAEMIDAKHLRFVADLQPGKVMEYVRELDLSPCSKAKVTSIAKTFSKFLRTNGYAAHDQLADVKKPTAKNLVEKRALTPEELSTVLDAMKGSQIHDLCTFLALTGFRIGEAVWLEWENLDFTRKEIRLYDKPHIGFTCKWGSGRTIPMTVEMQAIITRQPKRSSFVFTTKEGKPRTNNVQREFHRCVNKTSIQRPHELSPHTFRHTWITNALENGLDIRSVAEYAGHRNISTTQKYLHRLSTPDKMERDATFFVRPHTHHTSTKAV